jgi:hypothetical protein
MRAPLLVRGPPAARAASASQPSPRLPGVVVSFDRDAGRGVIRAGNAGASAQIAPDAPPAQTFPVSARDILSCGHRWLAVGEVVEFKVSDDGSRAVDILRSFETADGQSVGT